MHAYKLSNEFLAEEIGSEISAPKYYHIVQQVCLRSLISVKHQFLCPAVISVIIMSAVISTKLCDLVKSSHAMVCEVESEVESL